MVYPQNDPAVVCIVLHCMKAWLFVTIHKCFSNPWSYFAILAAQAAIYVFSLLINVHFLTLMRFANISNGFSCKVASRSLVTL